MFTKSREVRLITKTSYRISLPIISSQSAIAMLRMFPGGSPDQTSRVLELNCQAKSYLLQIWVIRAHYILSHGQYITILSGQSTFTIFQRAGWSPDQMTSEPKGCRTITEPLKLRMVSE